MAAAFTSDRFSVTEHLCTVGCRSEQEILADYTSMQTKIPDEFWADLKAQDLIEHNAPVPQVAPSGVS